jgi:phage baseplate assembly protein W
MTDVPHFALPFRFERNVAAVVEQDTTDEITDCMTSILLCPLGFRSELPAYGVEDPTFAMGAVDLDALAAAVRLWEPRADAVFTQHPDALDALVADVSARVGIPSAD